MSLGISGFCKKHSPMSKFQGFIRPFEIQINSKKLNVDRCIRCQISVCDHGVGKKLGKDTNLKRPTFHFSLFRNYLNRFQFGTVVKRKTYET
jgi:hypothetical protein